MSMALSQWPRYSLVSKCTMKSMSQSDWIELMVQILQTLHCYQMWYALL